VRGLLGKDQAVTVANIASVIGIEVRKALLESYHAHCQTYFESGQARNKEEYVKVMESLWLNPPMHPRMLRPITKVRAIKTRFDETTHITIKHIDDVGVERHKTLIAYEKACIAWNPKNQNDGIKVFNNFDARNKIAMPNGWHKVYKKDTITANNGLIYTVRGLNVSNNRIETMRNMCATEKLKGSQKEGRQDFSLTPSKSKGSMSLWDITEIITDPFDGDQQHG
jgi:hypothetical protein